MRTLLAILGFAAFCYGAGAVMASEIELPIDSEVKASITAATKYFHPQSCVSGDFRTVLEEFEIYWSVTLSDAARIDSESCGFTTVYVCKDDATIVFDDPDSRCAT